MEHYTGTEDNPDFADDGNNPWEESQAPPNNEPTN